MPHCDSLPIWPMNKTVASMHVMRTQRGVASDGEPWTAANGLRPPIQKASRKAGGEGHPWEGHPRNLNRSAPSTKALSPTPHLPPKGGIWACELKTLRKNVDSVLTHPIWGENLNLRVKILIRHSFYPLAALSMLRTGPRCDRTAGVMVFTRWSRGPPAGAPEVSPTAALPFRGQAFPDC